MQNLLNNISQVLGITILHSLWQGLIIFIVLRLFLLARPAATALTKYWVSYGALSVTLGWFMVTLFKELGHYDWLSTTKLQITPLTLPALIQEVNAPVNRMYFTVAQYMPYLTMIYVTGLIFNTLKLGMAWNSIYRIRQNISEAGFEGTLERLTQQLKITKYVKVAFSEWVDVPCVTGFIKPIILLPLSINSYLSAKEVEAILLHELAHIKRNDYLLNFIQQVIGILLFFNPFAHLINKVINQERENCCDDVVVQVAGNPLKYAQALLKLEENKQHKWQLAMAATTNKYELLNRIERIMKTKTQTVNIRPVLITLLALTCAVTSIAWFNPDIKDGKIVIKNEQAIHRIAAAITGPSQPVAEVAAKPMRKHKKNISFKYVSDTTKAAFVNDTTIKNKKYKIVIEDENGNKREYNSLNELPEKERNDFLGHTSEFKYAGIDSVTANKLAKFYRSDEFKKQVTEAQKMSLEVAKKVNTPAFKKMQKDITASAIAMTKHFNTPAFKKSQQKLIENSLKMAENAMGPEMQTFIADVAKNAANPEYYNSEEFKAKAEKLEKYYDSPEFKAKTDEVAKYYDSPEFEKQIKQMTKAYDSPAFKKQMEKIGKEFDSPKFKKQIKEMTKSFEKMGKDMDKAMQKDTVIIQKAKDKKTDDVYPKKPSDNKEINNDKDQPAPLKSFR